MIDRLEFREDMDQYGNVYGLLPPGDREIIGKINEMVDALNSLERALEEMREKQ